MKLINLYPEFTSDPYLTIPIYQHLVETLPFKDFDKDGYEVPTPLEHLHYEANGIELNRDIQFHIAPVQEWYHDIGVFQGEGFDEYFKEIKQTFTTIKTRKPDSSRARSREVYLVATGYKV